MEPVPTDDVSTGKEGAEPVAKPPVVDKDPPLPPRGSPAKNGASPNRSSMTDLYNKIDQSDVCPFVTGVCCCSVIVFLLSGLLLAALYSRPQRTDGEYTDWAVVIDAKECANVSKEIVDQGGAIGDVAVALLLCMGVTAPHLAGLGGGFVALFYNETSKKVRTLESIGFAPSLTTEDTFASNLTLYKSGATAAIVPGAMAGYEVLHRELGMLEWHKLFDPAIRLATEGFAIGPHFARSLSRHRDRIEAHAELKSRFWNNSGNRLLEEGDLLTQQPLADLLSDIAIHGGRFFYEGKVATDIADSVKKSGGLISEADLSDYKAEWKDPITVDLPYGLLFHSAASPGSGALLAAAVAQTAPNYALNVQHNPHADVALNGQELHRLVETLKFVYARRSELGDEQDAQNMEGGLVKEIVDKFNKTFNPNQALRSARDYGLKHPFAEDYGGAHLCVITPDGHALSITSSLNSEFGSLFTTARGILLNNYMDAFVKPSGTDASKKRANLPGPFKTPMTSMAPVILTRDQSPSPLHALFGGSGGLAGLSAVAQLITCASEKLYRPCIEDEMRVHPQLESTNFRVNVAGKGNYIDAVQVLQKYGHQVSEKFIPSTAIGIMPTREGVLVAINDAEHADGGDVGGA